MWVLEPGKRHSCQHAWPVWGWGRGAAEPHLQQWCWPAGPSPASPRCSWPQKASSKLGLLLSPWNIVPLQGERITSGSIVRRGGEPSAKKGRKSREINMKTSLKFDLCKTKSSRVGFSEIVQPYWGYELEAIVPWSSAAFASAAYIYFIKQTTELLTLFQFFPGHPHLACKVYLPISNLAFSVF